MFNKLFKRAWLIETCSVGTTRLTTKLRAFRENNENVCYIYYFEEITTCIVIRVKILTYS